MPANPFTLKTTITMPDRGTIVQDFDIHDGVYYIAQDAVKTGRCTISRVKDGKRLDRMSIPGSAKYGTHGDRVDLSLDDKGRVLVRMLFNGRWCRIPYVNSTSWTAERVLEYVIGYNPPLPKPGPSFQGEATKDGTTYRLYGVPYKVDGPTMAGNSGKRHADIPGRLEIIRDGKVMRRFDISHLGRDKYGKPVDVRLEPEGVCVEAGRVYIGIAIGSLSKQRHQMWTASIAELTHWIEPRYVYADRITLGRKDSDSVRWVQRALNVPDTGDLDDATLAASKVYQAKLGDDPEFCDGLLGPLQLRVLFAQFQPTITVEDES